MSWVSGFAIKIVKTYLIYLAPMVKASQISPNDPNGNYLTRQDVVADSWLLLFAGHETTANTLHYTMIYLAIELATQRELQKQIDSVIGDRPQKEWSYERDMGPLFNNLVGASFSETLRLIPPVLEMPKITRPNAQTLVLQGKSHVVPANTFIHADATSVQRNAKYWPHSPSRITPGKSDMNDFVPQRWFTSAKETNFHTKSTQIDAEDIDGYEKSSFESSHGGLYVPPKGTYLPFADGPRACPGRRFAQVEMTAVITTLFKTHTFELDVSKYASDSEVANMGKEERRQLYEKVKTASRKEIDSSISVIAVRLLKPIPLRVVKRGTERFMDCYV